MLDWYDPLILSRIQFAFVVSFHIIFPALTIGLASWLAVLEGLYLKTKHPIYMEIYDQWVKIFAVAFGMGVVSGVVMSYQFGTNWSEFSHKAGNVIGPLLAFEVLTAFFLEASFLGVMLFGRNRVGPKMHFFATLMVAVGTAVSAFWILSVNSWMQTPAGYRVAEDGLFYATNWFEVIFNPSCPYRLAHMLLAAYLSTAFFVGGVASWYIVKHQNLKHARHMFAMAMMMAVFVTPIQLLVGHAHGGNTLVHQPSKIAAMEGIWETQTGAALNLFAIPDETQERNHYEIQIPQGASYILTEDPNGEIKGLKAWPKEERPPVTWVFFAFRIMVGIGVLMLLTGLTAVFLLFKKRLFSNKKFHRWSVLMAPSGFIALLTGWIVTEVGRQPYTIFGVLKTSHSLSPITAHEVSVSLLVFLVVYTIVFGAGVFYILKLIQKGPNVGDWHDAYGTHGLDHPFNWSDIFHKTHQGHAHV